MMRHLLLAVLSCAVLAQAAAQAERFSDPALRAAADSLAQSFMIVDGHVDLPYRLKVSNFRFEKEFMGIPIETDEGDFDYVRAKAGGLNAPFMSIYIPADQQGADLSGGQALADSLIDMVTEIATELPEFALATAPDSVRAQFARGVVSLPMGMENGAPLATPADVKHFAERGIRYVTLTHAKDNQICDSSYDTTGTWGGLSPYGKTLLPLLNDAGVMIDISHVSDSTAYQVLRSVETPVIASHSSLRYYTPGFERNMSDSMLTLLGENGGVIMINFGSTFIDSAVVAARDGLDSTVMAELAARGLDEESEEAEAVADSVYVNNPGTFADVERVADHIDRAVQLAGIDHVGLGSDYDGVGNSLPTGLKDVSDYPNLIYVLLERGYAAHDIRKVCGDNLLRVWDAVEARRVRG